MEAEEWLGALLNANDALVTALMTFEQLDRSIDADSDSDDEMAEQAHLYKSKRIYEIQVAKDANIPFLVASDKGKESEVTQQLAGLHIGAKSSPGPEQRPPQPPRPVQPPEDEEDDFEEEDENDPFADRNAVATPKAERPEPSW